MCLLGAITRPNKSPTKKMNPTNVIKRTMKYFFDGDATTVSYKSDKLSACAETYVVSKQRI